MAKFKSFAFKSKSPRGRIEKSYVSAISKKQALKKLKKTSFYNDYVRRSLKEEK